MQEKCKSGCVLGTGKCQHSPPGHWVVSAGPFSMDLTHLGHLLPHPSTFPARSSSPAGPPPSPKASPWFPQLEEAISSSAVHAGKFPPALPPAPLIPLWCLCRAPPADPALCLPSNLPIELFGRTKITQPGERECSPMGLRGPGLWEMLWGFCSQGETPSVLSGVLNPGGRFRVKPKLFTPISLLCAQG